MVLACDGVWDVMTNQVSFTRIHSLTVTRSVSARCELTGSILCATLIVKSTMNALGENRHKTTHYLVQLGLSDHGCAIKELVMCWVLLNLIPRLFGQKRRQECIFCTGSPAKGERV